MARNQPPSIRDLWPRPPFSPFWRQCQLQRFSSARRTADSLGSTAAPDVVAITPGSFSP